MKVYPHRWQGRHRPIVATYENGQKIMWLLGLNTDGTVYATTGGKNGRYGADARFVADTAVDMYGTDRLTTAFGRDIVARDAS